MPVVSDYIEIPPELITAHDPNRATFESIPSNEKIGE